MKRLLLVFGFIVAMVGPSLAQTDPITALLFGSSGLQIGGGIGTPVVGVRGRLRLNRRGLHVGVRTNAGIYNMVTEVALQNGVNPALAHAIVRVESGYNCNARNGPSAGIMQTNYRTAAAMGVRNPGSCVGGLTAGMRYLRQAIAIHGFGCAGFSAYQSGTGVHACSAYGRRIAAILAGRDPGYVAARHRRVVFHRYVHRVRYHYPVRYWRRAR